MAEPRPPNVFTIPAGTPFLPTLAEALLSGALVPLPGADPLALAGVTVLLPTRRAVRAFTDVLAARLGREAAILPTVRPIGDIDEDEALLDPMIDPLEDRLTLPAAIPALTRKLALTRLTLAWASGFRREALGLRPDEPLRVAASAADALRLAGDLARLVDDMATANVGWEKIRTLVPDDHAEYFQLTLKFLEIVSERWPEYLRDNNRADPAARRDTLLRSAAERLKQHGSAGPIIAAGSTGSMPATRMLLAEIARLRNGAVVLPGLDQTLDAKGWQAIGDEDGSAAAHGHPQFALKQLIGHMRVARDAVKPLGAALEGGDRVRLLSEASRPAETLEAWAGFTPPPGALDGIDLIVARNEQEEATAIALAIREAVERPGATVGLVTPDRTLARRVAAELGRWGLAVDDSAGAPLANEPHGIFARLLAEAAVSDADPLKLASLLKHRFASFGLSRATCRQAAATLEVALFRGRLASGGIAGLAAVLERTRTETLTEKNVPLARKRLNPSQWKLAADLVAALTDCLGPIAEVMRSGTAISLADAAKLLAAALGKAAADETGSDAALWQGTGGAALATLLDGLVDDIEAAKLMLAPADIPFVFGARFADEKVTRPAGDDPRVHIWGTLEARLQTVDCLILGGLDEGVWPSAVWTDPWLSRAMRAAIALSPPERRLGLAAHDFFQGMAAPRVIVSRAEKRGGAATVESRWLQLIRVLIGKEEAGRLAARGHRYVDLARTLDAAPDKPRPTRRPEPAPPIAARPKHLSITEIETLIRDPYAIYARRILKLQPLDPLGRAPDGALRGTLIHDALGKFTAGWSGAYDAAAELRLREIGREALSAVEDFPDVHAVWSLRFDAIAHWFASWEAARSAGVEKRHAEISGKLVIPVPGGEFTLNGRADRIDLMANGKVAIYDFKTGSPQTERTVFAGLTPQMTLEAAMVREGGFPDIPAALSVADLAWLAVGRAGRQDPYVNAVRRGETADDLADKALTMLKELVTAFADPARPYLSRARPMMERARYIGDYDHLARVREWALVESEADVDIFGERHAVSAAEPVDLKTQQTTAEATHPQASAWVSANAGSGKTFVLSRRVIRLLLAGTDPARILCLTFTKAAAAEMAKRVFDILGEWATLPDAELSARIVEIEGHAPSAEALAPARRLFAKALNTPGGLKIQTIHAFCERLLHQFPFEANVAGHFDVLDERDEQALKEESRRSVLAAAYAEPDGVLGKALATVLPLVSDRMHEESLAKFIDERDAVYGWIASERAGSPDDAIAGLRLELGLADDETSEALRADIIAGNPFGDVELRRLFELLMSGSTKDIGAAERLEPFITSSDDAVKIDAWFDFLFTKDGPRKDVATKKTAAQWPGLDVALAEEAERIAELRDRLRTADLYESTAAMLRLADAAFAEYDRLKRARGVLDFEDLVVRTAMLLSRVDAPGWVHYKLDRGVEHILVDEAQDTSPRQWQVIQNLASDFFAGEGASDTVRTLFAVGDEKQSIFSFQGAVPAWFSRVQHKIGDAARSGGYTWYDRELHLSFRSAPVVLEAVDEVFRAEAVHAGLTAEPRPPHHEARRRNDIGRVIVWPVMKPPEKPETSNWTDAVDHLGQESPEVQLARRLAATISAWLANGERLADGRPIRPGGILILSRSRGALTDAINRELKKNDVPIAGADRLTLTEHIAVMDLMAAGRVALLPEDDLSLAAVLKSPLIGLDEDALFALAHDRGNKTLWSVLVEKASTDLMFAAAKQRIVRWRDDAELRDPHAFFARILGPDRGRHALLQRLGAEAEDIIDEFLAQTLAYERTNVPSLEGFLDWLIAGETEVKRDTETLRDEVRVMTVHGAKGLEADVVFLVDNGMDPAPASHDLRVLPLDSDPDPLDPGPVVWNRSIGAMPGAIATRIRAERVRTEEEYRRLLYVGMTRAKDRLYVVGIVKKPVNPDKDNRWHALVRRALEPEWQERKDADGNVTEYEWRPPSVVAPAEVTPKVASGRTELPSWAGVNAPAAPSPSVRLAPSSALAAMPVLRARREADTNLALERGRLVHRLLQSLPEVPLERRAEIGARYLDSAADEWKPEDRARLLTEVLAVVADPAFAEAFAPGSRAEVEIAGRLGGAIISGRVDRLAVTGKRVLIVDYKTNRPAPATLAEVPEVYVGQLAVYRAVLQRLYPSKAVAAALLWTDTPALLEIPEAALILAESQISAGQGHTESARQTARNGPVA